MLSDKESPGMLEIIYLYENDGRWELIVLIYDCWTPQVMLPVKCEQVFQRIQYYIGGKKNFKRLKIAVIIIIITWFVPYSTRYFTQLVTLRINLSSIKCLVNHVFCLKHKNLRSCRKKNQSFKTTTKYAHFNLYVGR